MVVAASLFLITALATGWQVFQLLMWGVWGKPSNPMECVSLLGSLALFFGSVVTFGGRPFGGILAGCGCLLLWVFYGPAVWHTVSAAMQQPGTLRPVAFLPPGLLLLSSLLCPIVVRFGANRPPEPDAAGEMNQRL
jgi:hypothetical protein